MRIGILSFHASHNFGSMLQNYALQRFLIAEGHIVETINLRSDKQRYMYNHPLCIGRTNPTLKRILSRVKDFKWLVTESRRWSLFERFLKDHLNLSQLYRNWDEIKASLSISNYDAIIVGSDQIWNTFCRDFDWSYFLPDDIGPIRKLSFSTSFGSAIPRTKQDPFRVSKIKESLANFSFISVREKDASEYLQGLLDRSIPITVDPTLLADPLIYHELIKEPIVKEPYIYYYTPSHNPDFIAEKMALELAELLGLKVITSYSRFMDKTPMVGVLSGPIEFLNLVNNAQLVVGKSYHLVIFSILFHKNFITLRRENDSRVNSLLERLSITERNMESMEDYYKLKEIDYPAVDSALFSFRQESVSLLRNALQ